MLPVHLVELLGGIVPVVFRDLRPGIAIDLFDRTFLILGGVLVEVVAGVILVEPQQAATAHGGSQSQHQQRGADRAGGKQARNRPWAANLKTYLGWTIAYTHTRRQVPSRLFL